MRQSTKVGANYIDISNMMNGNCMFTEIRFQLESKPIIYFRGLHTRVFVHLLVESDERRIEGNGMNYIIM